MTREIYTENDTQFDVATSRLYDYSIPLAGYRSHARSSTTQKTPGAGGTYEGAYKDMTNKELRESILGKTDEEFGNPFSGIPEKHKGETGKKHSPRRSALDELFGQ